MPRKDIRGVNILQATEELIKVAAEVPTREAAIKIQVQETVMVNINKVCRSISYRKTLQTQS